MTPSTGPILVALPLSREYALLAEMFSRSAKPREYNAGRLKTLFFESLNLHLFRAGQGKAEYALTTGHILDRVENIRLFVCAGAAGGLAPGISCCDLVVGTETLEHDYKSSFSQNRPPRFPASPVHFEKAKQTEASGKFLFPVHFGTIASGDEDILSPERRRELYETTRALCVAWEGAGGARAAHLMNIPFLEIRAVTDLADHQGKSDFKKNLAVGMERIAGFISLLSA